jgi:oligopeptide/dipeptide ABC transporter ATP-binding protein
MACAMRSIRGSAEMATAPLLAFDELCVTFDTEQGPVRAVRGVSLDLQAGECLAVVGESGSGKSQLVMASLGLLSANGAARGSVRFQGEEILGVSEQRISALRGARLGLVSQDPMNALTPHLRVGVQLTEFVLDRCLMSRAQARDRALALMRSVGLREPESRYDQYPHELSGGQRQRVALAMALMPGPALLFADEPTTALDVTVQAQVLGVLGRLRTEGLCIVVITHDLGVVAGLAERVAVMYAGAVVEVAPVAELFAAPRHPYTAGLLASVPRLSGMPDGRLACIEGQPPRPHEQLRGCPFAPRCPLARDRCRESEPALYWSGERASACHAPLPRGWAA